MKEPTPDLPQGDLGLLRTDVAQRLLASSIPARYAYVARDGTPRVVASWFVWTGEEVVMPTFVAAPHARHSAYRLDDLRAHPDVAITIDTEDSPPEALAIRGRAAITEVQGIVPEYAEAAQRYLARNEAAGLLAMLEDPRTRMARIAVRPTWVGLIDFRTRLPSALGGVQG